MNTVRCEGPCAGCQISCFKFYVKWQKQLFSSFRGIKTKRLALDVSLGGLEENGTLQPGTGRRPVDWCGNWMCVLYTLSPKFHSYTSLVGIYDGASVNSRKKKLNLFSPPFFYQNSRKKNLNLFSPTFFQKQQKKNI